MTTPSVKARRRSLTKYRRTAARSRVEILDAINSLAEDVALNTYETQAVHDRLDKLEPEIATLKKLEPDVVILKREREQRIGVANFLKTGRIWLMFPGAGLIIWIVTYYFGKGLPPTPPGHP